MSALVGDDMELVKQKPVPPETLFHYTNQAGLIGIISTSTMWATMIRYMNDAAEYQLAFEICRRQIKEVSEVLDRGIEFSKVLENTLWAKERMNLCVASFSGLDDRLSQWRGYAGGSAGFCLGFEPQRLAELAAESKPTSFFLAPCIYDSTDQDEAVRDLVMIVLDHALQKEKLETKAYINIQSDFPRLAARIKNDAFHEEAEWRLISEDGVNSDCLRFRPGPSMIIPYSVIDLGANCDALRSITVGPTAHPKLALEAVETLLMSKGIRHQVDVRMSKSPYRAW